MAVYFRFDFLQLQKQLLLDLTLGFREIKLKLPVLAELVAFRLRNLRPTLYYLSLHLFHRFCKIQWRRRRGGQVVWTTPLCIISPKFILLSCLCKNQRMKKTKGLKNCRHWLKIFNVRTFRLKYYNLLQHKNGLRMQMSAFKKSRRNVTWDCQWPWKCQECKCVH